MITFTSLGEYGRLGNQLFQYAILLAISNKRGYEIKIPNFHNKSHHNQKCLLDNFNISAKFLTSNDKILHNYYESDGANRFLENYTYNPNVFNIPDNTNIHGFFQNYQYYKECESLIIDELTPKLNIIDENRKTFDKIKNKYLNFDIVSLHLRRGDTDLSMYGNNINNLDVNSRWYYYFNNAKKFFIGKKVKFLVFSGGNRNNTNDDINWCKKNLIGDEFIYYDYDNTVMNDFTLMYLCDHHILSPISSLSWWVGFLNKKKINKIIVSPQKYYYLAKELNSGFYPDNFKLC